MKLRVKMNVLTQFQRRNIYNIFKENIFFFDLNEELVLLYDWKIVNYADEN